MNKEEAYEIVYNYLQKDVNVPSEIYEALKLLKYEEYFING